MSEDSPFLVANPHLKEFIQLLAVARKESDRGAVLVHASMLDELLKRSIEARLTIGSLGTWRGRLFRTADFDCLEANSIIHGIMNPLLAPG